MQGLKILDCTLRDGGYVNDWMFGRDVARGIHEDVTSTGADIFEVGFMRDNPRNPDRCIFPSMASIRETFPRKEGVIYAAMVETGCLIPQEMIEPSDGNTIDYIRFITWKNKLQLAYDYSKELLDKGYEVCIQPTRVNQYTLDEYAEMIEFFNPLKPRAMYIVDTFGTLFKNDLMAYVKVAEEHLWEGGAIGYHAHNNMMQAVSNMEAFLEVELTHEKIIDGSVMGIGRGSGNLPLEILLEYLNRNYGGTYNVDGALKAAEEYVEDIYREYPWGYMVPYFLTSKLNANPNYALVGREIGLADSEIREFLESRPDDMDRIRFLKQSLLDYRDSLR